MLGVHVNGGPAHMMLPLNGGHTNGGMGAGSDQLVTALKLLSVACQVRAHAARERMRACTLATQPHASLARPHPP